ncbi:hypothetical protein BaRGS_00025131 [Batillaria attramentaria]|uniref:Uncharacterized protein n=1 Tax=Batillaria attramentaria TaxID=370345 RepID=A0ABD0K932_9CAEN
MAPKRREGLRERPQSPQPLSEREKGERLKELNRQRCKRYRDAIRKDAARHEIQRQKDMERNRKNRQRPLVFWDRLDESWETFQSFQDNSRRVDIKLNEKMSNRRRQLFDVIEL